MSSSSDNFDGLKKVLKWKRHEQPPPRCMNEFSNQVLARLEAGETEAKKSWWDAFGFEFGLKPALAGACTVLAGGFLIYGIIFSMNTPERSLHPGEEGTGLFPNANLTSTPPGLPLGAPEISAGLDNSTNPILNTDDSLGGAFRLQVKPVNFTPGN